MESNGVSPAHTSVPPNTLSAAAGGRRHLVVAGSGARVAPLLATVGRPDAVELVVVAPSSVALSATIVEDDDELETVLRDRLAAAMVGMRLHLAGSDAFVRRMSAAALDAGLLPDEIAVIAETDPAAYRVACVHCRAITEPVTETVMRCAGCRRALFVYHHFSRRKAAYMGFQADAEVPGELPEARSGVPCP